MAEGKNEGKEHAPFAFPLSVRINLPQQAINLRAQFIYYVPHSLLLNAFYTDTCK
jgi:hypothetical protein